MRGRIAFASLTVQGCGSSKEGGEEQLTEDRRSHGTPGQAFHLRYPGFPVGISGSGELHGAFLIPSCTRGRFQCCVAGNSGTPCRKTSPRRVRGTAGPSAPLRSGRDDKEWAAVPERVDT